MREKSHLNPGRQYNTTFFGMVHFRRACIKKYFSTFSKTIEFPKEKPKPRAIVERDIEDCLLHGSCLIFSPLYVAKLEGLYSGTFLYLEEDILKQQMDILGYKMLYSHELKINHVGSSSTNFVCTDYQKKVRRQHKYLIKSSLHYNWVLLRMKFSISFIIQWLGRKLNAKFNKM